MDPAAVLSVLEADPTQAREIILELELELSVVLAEAPESEEESKAAFRRFSELFAVYGAALDALNSAKLPLFLETAEGISRRAVDMFAGQAVDSERSHRSERNEESESESLVRSESEHKSSFGSEPEALLEIIVAFIAQIQDERGRPVLRRILFASLHSLPLPSALVRGEETRLWRRIVMVAIHILGLSQTELASIDEPGATRLLAHVIYNDGSLNTHNALAHASYEKCSHLDELLFLITKGLDSPGSGLPQQASLVTSLITIAAASPDTRLRLAAFQAMVKLVTTFPISQDTVAKIVHAPFDNFAVSRWDLLRHAPLNEEQLAVATPALFGAVLPGPLAEKELSARLLFVYAVLQRNASSLDLERVVSDLVEPARAYAGHGAERGQVSIDSDSDVVPSSAASAAPAHGVASLVVASAAHTPLPLHAPTSGTPIVTSEQQPLCDSNYTRKATPSNTSPLGTIANVKSTGWDPQSQCEQAANHADEMDPAPPAIFSGSHRSPHDSRATQSNPLLSYHIDLVLDHLKAKYPHLAS